MARRPAIKPRLVAARHNLPHGHHYKVSDNAIARREAVVDYIRAFDKMNNLCKGNVYTFGDNIKVKI